jgi:hypothetical protein
MVVSKSAILICIFGANNDAIKQVINAISAIENLEKSFNE